MSATEGSPCARALAAARSGQWSDAEHILADIIHEVFSASVRSIAVSKDKYSLNSLNGLVTFESGEDYFFKFHHEEGEEVTLDELYRGEVLAAAGLPVDRPILVSRELGKQLLLYRRHTGPRLADICDQLDFTPDSRVAAVLQAQTALDELTCSIYLNTLHQADPEIVGSEPINQLFHHRLTTPPDLRSLGGRAKRFFYDRQFKLPGAALDAQELRAARWVVNGIGYRDSMDDLLARSLALLEPRSLARFGAVVAHGDAHNANVWFEALSAHEANLVLFDPAFAGANISALLAEVKATFHNVLAHPRWLYAPSTVAELFRVNARYSNGVIYIDTDWQLSDLRQSFLSVKAAKLWKPLLVELGSRGLLPSDWRATLRCALFCCPTLVMDLCAGGAGGHTPESSALGLAIAVAAGSEPESNQTDVISQFLELIAP
jgi:hypothetical protein